jgi:membrane associated rhomboid family serine protease
MNWALIAANVAAFMVQRAFDLTDRFALDAVDPHLAHFFTYSLLHADTLHLASNMLFLYIFGNNVNDKMGHIGYLAFYLAGGIFSGVIYVLGSDGYVIGASGAVYAVTGAYIVLFPRAHVTMLYFWFYVGVIEIPSAWFIGFFFAKDLFMNFSHAVGNVAHTAHIGGAAFGCTVTAGLLASHLLPRDHFDIVALFKQWNRRRQFRDLTASGYDPFAYTGPRVAVENRLPPPSHPQQDRIHEIRGQISDAIDKDDFPKAAELYIQLREIDPEQMLARQAQLDVAAQLASQQLYPQAAEAYELFLRHYRNFEQVEQVELMLGLIYARYLEKYDRAKEYLIRAMARLHGDREIRLARNELDRIEPLTGTGSAAT